MLDRVQLAFANKFHGDGYINLALAMITQAVTDLRTRAGLSAAIWLLSEDFDIIATCLKMDARKLKYDIFHHQFFEKEENCEMIRTFRLYRTQDMSGVSGTGIVAEGIVFKTGKTVICWSRSPYSVTVFDSLEEMLQVHGHHGKTEIQWQDDFGKTNKNEPRERDFPEKRPRKQIPLRSRLNRNYSSIETREG